MQLNISGFSPTMRDNDLAYLSHLQGIINSVDELSSVQVTNTPSGIRVRIAPSTPEYSQPVLKIIKDFHYLLNLRIEFSKSIRRTSTVEYQIYLEE